jgi:uncharacterized protein (TIGR03083 family)
MPSLADRTISALRNEHDTVAAIAADLTDDQLTGTSGAAEWTVAQVLSHLGSGAEITLAGLQAALGEREAHGEGFNESVWDRWNAMSPADQRAGFVEHNAALVSAFEALDEHQRQALELPIGFMPNPLSVASFAGLRLSEVAQHDWDVRVARDPAAGLLPESADVLAEQFSHELGFLLGFIGKADRIAGPVLLTLGESGYGLSIADSVAFVSTIEQPTANLTGPFEAAIRLLAGRLRAPYTPSDVTVTGNVTLDDLRAVFPGF